MADNLYELLAPQLASTANATSDIRSRKHDTTTTQYLNRLPTLSLQALQTTEPQSLAQSSHSTLLSLQALSNRSHKAFVTSADNLSNLRTAIPQLARNAHELRDAIPKLDEEAVLFSSKYSRAAENVALERRKKVMQLARNVDRLSDILELPTLLSTAVASAAASSGGTGSSASTTYSTALDLYAHIKRLQTLYPDSPLVKDVVMQAEEAMKNMTSNLIAGLRMQNLRLAAAMRTVGWLRRVAPELENLYNDGEAASGEGALGAVFLICRLANLVSMLEALDPLRELADQETHRRLHKTDKQTGATGNWSDGHQTEKYLKRYIEIFREQSFAIVSLYRNIFSPDQSESELAVAGLRGIDARIKAAASKPARKEIPFQRLPSALATFPMQLVELLADTLRTYLPNVRDKSSRESLLTQVLYCAASLGRLGGDFGMILTELGDEEDEEDDDLAYEWEEVTRKHRALAGRLEQLTGGGGVGGGGGGIGATTTGSSSKGTLQVASPV
ncbi:Dor1-like family protein [Aspergillus homomorphus CBS 101889]|uniref:Conserved oligomeric Golgi complex subunit 8 n=1 Tax=Aspergillus homomorphus (strain CBS 101889) TaxID=1450537 RepID=A0A395HSV9_ASPHC|nr:Dor1-like family protein [Aspergillus homomorphus CBS 101889]RAL10917.1 Dor1-like family protein [Aspergillus homomorphus CBS 101889]